MSTAIATIPAALQNMMPTLPVEQQQLLAATFGDAMLSFGSTFNRLSIKGSRFRLMEGKQEVITKADHLDIIILSIGAENYNVYYAGEYDPTRDDVKPTAMWGANEPIPACVPPAAVQADGKPGRKPYSIRRRIVFTPYHIQENGTGVVDLSKLYVFDVNAMSMFGDSDPAINAYSFGNYITMLRNAGVYPCLLPTRLIFDTKESVPVVKFVPFTANGSISLLPVQTMTDVMTAIQSDKRITDLLDWKTSDEFTETTSSATTNSTSAASATTVSTRPVAPSPTAEEARPETAAPTQASEPAYTQPVESVVPKAEQPQTAPVAFTQPDSSEGISLENALDDLLKDSDFDSE